MLVIFSSSLCIQINHQLVKLNKMSCLSNQYFDIL